MKKYLLFLLLILLSRSNEVKSQGIKTELDSAIVNFNKGDRELKVISCLEQNCTNAELDISTLSFINFCLGQFYFSYQNYSSALNYYLKASQIAQYNWGKTDTRYLKALSYLANCHFSMGNYNVARNIFEEMSEIQLGLYGDSNQYYLSSLISVAALDCELGEDQKALELNQLIAKNGKISLGEKSANYLICLNNMATNLSNLGNQKQALILIQQIIDIRKEKFGEKDEHYLLSLANKAKILSEQGNYKVALEICHNVENLSRSTFGEYHRIYLANLDNTSILYANLGDFKDAFDTNLRVTELLRKILDENHRDYLISLGNLASCYSYLDEYNEALRINSGVIANSKNNSEISKIYYRRFIINQSFFYFKLSNFYSSLPYRFEADSLIKGNVISNFISMTEKQRTDYWKMYEYDLRNSPLFYSHDTTATSKYIGQAYNNALFSKGLLLQSTRSMDDLLLESGNDNVLSLFENLKIEKLQLQRLYEKPISERYLNADSLEEVAYKMEKELVSRSKTYGDYTKNLKVTWSDVKANLKEADVAIEFVEYPNLKGDTLFYAALMLRKNWLAPKMVQLFTKAEMEVYTKLDVSKIYGKGYVSSKIKNLVFTPLFPYIQEDENIYFSASGLLHQLAIESLPANDSNLMGDVIHFFRLTSTKELAIKDDATPIKTSALYGGLQYDITNETMVAESANYSNKPSLYAIRGLVTDSTTRSGWNYLSGTLSEVEGIGKEIKKGKYKYTIYSGAKGNEESFKALSGKKTGILHIATHGFFLTPDETTTQPFFAMRMGGDEMHRYNVDPMERAGLMLAGGNRAWKRDSIPTGIEDGILTAKEISQLDLRGTDLVVLSACETGLGEVSGEGVFGLQRAFKQAGCKTIIMSLWNVSDEATNVMMSTFYHELLRGKSKREAFLIAQNSCRQKFKEPYYWAAFVMLD